MVDIKCGVTEHVTELSELRYEIKSDVESSQPRIDSHIGLNSNTATQSSPHQHERDSFDALIKYYEDKPQPNYDTFRPNPTTFMGQHPVDTIGGRHPLFNPPQFQFPIHMGQPVMDFDTNKF